jgi:putative nucleotidyltransferase with HDIG domain
MGGNKRQYQLFYRASIIAAILAVIGVYFAVPPSAGAWKGALVFALFAIVSEFMPVNLRGNMGYVTITVPIHWASMVLFGPFLAMLSAAIPVPAVNLTGWTCANLLAKKPDAAFVVRFRRMLTALAGHWQERADYPFAWTFEIIIANTALDVLNVGAAALAYTATGGILGTREFFSSASLETLAIHLFLPFFAGLVAYFLFDELRFVTANLLDEGIPQGRRDWYNFVLSWKILLIESVQLTWTQYIFLPPVTFLVIYLYVHVGVLSGLVALGPFLSLRLAYQKDVERQKVFRDTVATLGTYMQHYHPYTRGHLKRVAEMSERLARELKLPADSVMLMPYAGLLHDIGKVGVSEEILDKVGQLTDEEWNIIKEHPIKGAEIIEHLEFLDKTVDWIKYHHRWANGSGYPNDGKRNGDIPIEAYIIAVADAFDAMTDDREMSLSWVCDSCGYVPENGDRPKVCPSCGATKNRTYREPLSIDEALDEIRRGAGTQFEPEIVKAFLRMVDRDGVRLGDGD